MIIQSKFHDYYDTVAKMAGVDKTIVYIREEKIIEIPHQVEIVKIAPYIYGERIEVYTVFGFVGFCGKIYPCAKHYNKGETKIIYDLDEMLELFKSYHSQDATKKWAKYRKGYVKLWNNYLEVVNSNYFKTLFVEYHVPIFCSRSLIYVENVYEAQRKGYPNLVLNPSLDHLSFVKIKDHYTTYQDIMMYLSGVLGSKEKDTVQISDKDLLTSKGFDPIYGFRKMKKDKI